MEIGVVPCRRQSGRVDDVDDDNGEGRSQTRSANAMTLPKHGSSGPCTTIATLFSVGAPTYHTSPWSLRYDRVRESRSAEEGRPPTIRRQPTSVADRDGWETRHATMRSSLGDGIPRTRCVHLHACIPLCVREWANERMSDEIDDLRAWRVIGLLYSKFTMSVSCPMLEATFAANGTRSYRLTYRPIYTQHFITFPHIVGIASELYRLCTSFVREKTSNNSNIEMHMLAICVDLTDRKPYSIEKERINTYGLGVNVNVKQKLWQIHSIECTMRRAFKHRCCQKPSTVPVAQYLLVAHLFVQLS